MTAISQVLAAAGRYIPATNPRYSGANPPAAAPSAGFLAAGPCWFNESSALDNGGTVVSVGMYAGVSCTLTMKIILRTSSTTADVVVSQAFSHPGGGWADLTLSSPYLIPGSGTYYVGANFSTDPSIKYNATNNRAISANITGNGQAIVESSGAVMSFRATYG